MEKSRRGFFSDAARMILASGAYLSANNNISAEIIPGAEVWNTDKADDIKNDKIFKIGGVFGLYSHTDSTWWRYFNPPEGYPRATGMRITHIWCIDPIVGKRIADRLGAEMVPKFTDMTGKVDAVFIDDFFATPYMPDLSIPYLEAGIPCCFDRPMASSISGLMKVIETSKRTGTPFMAPSAYEYLKEVETAQMMKNNIGGLVSYNARNIGEEVYKYVFHGLCFSLKIIGTDVTKIAHRTRQDHGSANLTILEHKGDNGTIYGTIHHANYEEMLCEISLFGRKERKDITCASSGRPWYLDIFSFLPMQHAMERMIKTGKPPESIEYTEAKIRIFISLLYSHYEKNGEMVEIGSVPEKWDAGCPKGFDRSYPQEIIDRYKKIFKKV